jgi:hypothetical protein
MPLCCMVFEEQIQQALEKVLVNMTGGSGSPQEILAAPFVYLSLLMKALGIAAGVYLVYLIISLILAWKRNKRLKRMEEKLDDLSAKVNMMAKHFEKRKK